MAWSIAHKPNCTKHYPRERKQKTRQPNQKPDKPKPQTNLREINGSLYFFQKVDSVLLSVEFRFNAERRQLAEFSPPFPSHLMVRYGAKCLPKYTFNRLHERHINDFLPPPHSRKGARHLQVHP